MSEWTGTDEEKRALKKTLVQCECTDTKQCSVHVALEKEQRLVNGLIFMRRRRESLLEEEFHVETADYEPEDLAPWIRQYWFSSERLAEPSLDGSSASERSSGSPGDTKTRSIWPSRPSILWHGWQINPSGQGFTS